MKNRRAWAAALIGFAFAAGASAQYKDALPGYRFTFPRDHFNHPDFQTEWWYYTGNVKSTDGHRFGFELTFFRQGLDRETKSTGAWDVRDLYLAHLALSDLDGGKFIHTERTNRAGPGIAGVNEAERRIWNGNWQVLWQGDRQILQAIAKTFAIHFTLSSAKPPVIHGNNGVSQKGEGQGRASHYVSLTRLLSAGEIESGGRHFQVTGTAWMDHEFFTRQLEPDQVGWDWISIQFADKTELMLFQIRRKDGSIDPHSAGTFVNARGDTIHLDTDEFTMEPTNSVWRSPATGALYPLAWKISIAKLSTVVDCSTSLPSQELSSAAGLSPAYWEGSIALVGSKGRTHVTGVGYLEMTGYDRPVEVPR